jgi:glycosyltransferase involved in cell wall biosynthesis
VGTASQLIPRKGYSTLLQAASRVLQIHPNVKFVIVGSGEEKYSQSLYNLSKKLGIIENIIFTGYREDISQIMNILDIVVLPSTHPEGFSRLLLEAMASSKPVVASRIGGNPEAVEDGRTGLIVPPGDVDSLAKAIQHLVQNRELRQSMGQAGRQRVKERFSIEINVNKIESIYEELLCRNM